ncbi:hypothetical protein CPB85DRAFT_110770 [Mucidula mucida]|nr:hypothetical protein CPB85DRAFT_110770 [Mucidula mucida]
MNMIRDSLQCGGPYVQEQCNRRLMFSARSTLRAGKRKTKLPRTRVKQNCGLSRLSSPNVTLTIQGWTDFESFRWQSNAERRGARNMIDRGNPCGHIRRAPVKRKISRNILLDASVPQPIPPLQLPTTYDSSFSEINKILFGPLAFTLVDTDRPP